MPLFSPLELDRDSADLGSVVMEWFLEGAVETGRAVERHRIGGTAFRIGRDRDADLPLRSRLVSKLHAELLVTGDAAFLRDFGSTNGTFVNGRRVLADMPTPVGPDDLLQFADLEFRLGREEEVDNGATFVEMEPELGWIISGMTELLEHERLFMLFQPVVDIHTGGLVGAEALARSDVRSLESPGAMFSAAAQLGWSDRLSQLCRRRAVETIVDAPGSGLGFQRGDGSLALFVNTDPREELDEYLLDSLRSLRESADNLPIVLEIHETAVPGLEEIATFKAALADLDIQLAYDDFGAGQSRLLEITRVPPDYLKFDRCLVKDIDRAAPAQRQLLATLVDTMRAAGVGVLAEGLEREAEVEVCRELGFEFAQGYYFGRPMPLDELSRG